jgi:hypothetical protein
MYTPKHIAEAMAELFDDPKWEGGMGATTIAWCNLWDQVASETGLSEEALMQLIPPDREGDAAPYRETRRSRQHTPCRWLRETVIGPCSRPVRNGEIMPATASRKPLSGSD